MQFRQFVKPMFGTIDKVFPHGDRLSGFLYVRNFVLRLLFIARIISHTK